MSTIRGVWVALMAFWMGLGILGASFEKAKTLYNAHDYVGALAQLQAPEASKQAEPLRDLYVGMCEAQLGRWPEAASTLAAYLDTRPAPADASRAWYWLGNARLFQKQFDGAEEAFLKAVASAPAWASGFRGLGLAELERKNNQAAYEAWLQAVKLDPKDERSKYFLGRLFYEADLPNEAAAWLREALALSPGDWEAATYLGLCAEALGMDETAVKLYRKALEDSERNHKPYPLAFVSLANYLRKKGEDEEALALLERGAQECPEASELAAFGGMLAKNNQVDRAVETYRRAIALNANLSQPHYRLALLLNSLGRTEESRAEMARFQAAKAEEDRHPKTLAVRKE